MPDPQPPKEDPQKEVLFRKLRRRFQEYEEATVTEDKLSQDNAKRAILDELP